MFCQIERNQNGDWQSGGSVKKTVAPTNVSAEVAVDEPTQPVVTKGPHMVQVEVPAHVTLEPSKKRTKIASPNSLSSKHTRSVGSENVPQLKIGEEEATEFTLSEAILEQIVAEVGGIVRNLAKEPRPPPPEEEVRSEIRTKTSSEEVKPLEITFLEFLHDSVVPLLKYLDTKREKYIVRKESGSYVELIRNRTKLKRVVAMKRKWAATAMAKERAASSAAECAAAKATLQEQEDQL
ncbi:hypothetical protein AXG93_3213s1000 [Marchantia polymorpha subsp. ruderalis]|uniref:Uncharacterized protein n=1 Tax=Marchantia polymorpha subsp. ruderalis TaxID=1480154 RepID=A0A176VGC6_MARPO|nr:hypothetical protein AXG93_3213s1000 [Marchantia polymorpha subsp. ruderalis]